jgi:hypothetical protein
MFYTVLTAMIMLFTGAALIDRWLRERPLFFLLFWFACAWLTLLAVLLAFFDMLVLRAAARRERRLLEERYLEPEARKDDDHQGPI